MSHTVFLVGIVLPQTLTENTYPQVSIIGCFNELQDAKKAVETNAAVVYNNPESSLTIYKVPLGECRLYGFTQKDLRNTDPRLLEKMQSLYTPVPPTIPTTASGTLPPLPQTVDTPILESSAKSSGGSKLAAKSDAASKDKSK